MWRRGLGLGGCRRLTTVNDQRRHELARAYFPSCSPAHFRQPGNRPAGRQFLGNELAYVSGRFAGNAPYPQTRRGHGENARGRHWHGGSLSAIHLFALYPEAWLERRGFSATPEHAGRNILTLPLFPAMRLADVARVVRDVDRNPASPPAKTHERHPQLSIVIPVYNEELNLPLLFAGSIRCWTRSASRTR